MWWPSVEEWFEGKIVMIYDNHTLDVEYDDGDEGFYSPYQDEDGYKFELLPVS